MGRVTHPTEEQVLRCFGKNADKVMAVDFDYAGFTIWLNEPYIFANNNAGCAGFEYDDQWEYGILTAVKWDADSITENPDYIRFNGTSVQSQPEIDLPELVASGKTKVKKTNRAFRIWIEGTKLVKAGFDSSVAYTIDYDVEGGTISLIIDPKGERKVTASRPIIDLHDQKVGEVFDAGDQIEVQYFDNGVIRFRRAI